MKQLFYILIMLVFIASCKKEANVSKIPQIKLLSLSITELIQFKDSLVIEIEYIDGDGDIGEEDPDKNSIYVKDKRLNEADYYFIKPLSPPNSKIQIQGKVRVNIKNVFLLGSANQEFTNFEIKLRDKAGNWSNLIVTPEIIIKKE